MPRFVVASRFETPLRELFSFHERADALVRLTPPWEKSRVVLPPSSLAVGTRVIIESFIGPLRVRLEAEHIRYERDVEFVDRLVRGPFASWVHRHRFFAEGTNSVLIDEIEYTLALAPFSAPADSLIVRPRLTKLFAFRHAETARALGVFPAESIDANAFLGLRRAV